jgi:hypothetical protein
MIQSGKIDRSTNTEIMKLIYIMEYSKNMGAVDRSDMMITSLQCVRKSMKWYRKFFFHLLDITLLNSHAVYNAKLEKILLWLIFSLLLSEKFYSTAIHQDQPLDLEDHHLVTNP